MSTSPAPSAPVSQDRITTLVIAGLFQILLAGFCALLSVMMLALVFLGPRIQAAQLAQAPPPAVMPQPPNAPPANPSPANPPPANPPSINRGALIQGMVLYVLATIAFLWLGIGLIRTRRWAWTLTIVGSWLWLIVGSIAFVAFVCFLGPASWKAVGQQGQLPPGVMMFTRIVTTVTVACIYVFLPALFLLLCNHKSVRETCRRRDSRIAWTERCPMPVLALCLILVFSGLSMFSLAGYNWTMPLFGVYFSGGIGATAVVAIAVILLALAWGNYHLWAGAWWATLILWLASTINSFVTFWRSDLLTMYQKMGIPPDQVDLVRKMGLFDLVARWGPWMVLATGAVCLIYLFWIRRYFAAGAPGPAATPPAIS